MDIKLTKKWAGTAYKVGTVLHVLGPGEEIGVRCVDPVRARKLIEMKIAKPYEKEGR